MWTTEEAIALATKVEQICKNHGCHVALTGGCLYGGSKKDCDLIIYRVRQADDIKQLDLLDDLEAVLGLRPDNRRVGSGDSSWCWKLRTADGKSVDLLFPDE